MNIGLIGNGFVGNAIYQNLKFEHSFFIYDIDKKRRNVEHVREVCHKCSIIFVSLPTPMLEDGRCDLSVVYGIMNQIAYWYNNNIIILKSTVPPGTCEAIKKIHPKLRLVFNPEFLTEANSVEDFRNCERMIFGGIEKDTSLAISLMKSVFPEKIYVNTDTKTAETVKYFLNTFLATKISFANEFYQLCETLCVSYKEVRDLALLDPRIGKSHLMVPGHDGQFGFGGVCFPKDLYALIETCIANGVEPKILKAVRDKNLEVRKVREWEKLRGRAISDEKK
jgi:nucleotide sugar dehydrogenase